MSTAISRIEKVSKDILFHNFEGDILRYDLLSKKYYKTYSSNKSEKEVKLCTAKNFFKGLDYNNLIELVKDMKLERLLKFSKNKGYSPVEVKNMGTVLDKLSKIFEYEDFIVNGFIPNTKMKGLKVQMIDKGVWKFLLDNIIGVSSHNCIQLMQDLYSSRKDYYKNNGYTYDALIDLFRKAVNLYNLGRFRNLKNIESIIIELFSSVDNFSYCLRIEKDGNMEEFIKFLYNAVNYENIEIYDLKHKHLDYIRMSEEMNKNNPKFPRYITSRHDIVSKQYSYISKEDLSIEYKYNYFFENKKYKIVVPKSTKEICNEGIQLNHCVPSYIDDIISGRCDILFLREDKEIPFVTLAIEDGKITQVKGNRDTTPEDAEVLKFVGSFAKEKTLQLSYM